MPTDHFPFAQFQHREHGDSETLPNPSLKSQASSQNLRFPVSTFEFQRGGSGASTGCKSWASLSPLALGTTHQGLGPRFPLLNSSVWGLKLVAPPSTSSCRIFRYPPSDPKHQGRHYGGGQVVFAHAALGPVQFNLHGAGCIKSYKLCIETPQTLNPKPKPALQVVKRWRWAHVESELNKGSR